MIMYRQWMVFMSLVIDLIGQLKPDDHTTRTTDTPGFKPFTKFQLMRKL